MIRRIAGLVGIALAIGGSPTAGQTVDPASCPRLDPVFSRLVDRSLDQVVAAANMEGAANATGHRELIAVSRDYAQLMRNYALAVVKAELGDRARLRELRTAGYALAARMNTVAAGVSADTGVPMREMAATLTALSDTIDDTFADVANGYYAACRPCQGETSHG